MLLALDPIANADLVSSLRLKPRLVPDSLLCLDSFPFENSGFECFPFHQLEIHTVYWSYCAYKDRNQTP